MRSPRIDQIWKTEGKITHSDDYYPELMKSAKNKFDFYLPILALIVASFDFCRIVKRSCKCFSQKEELTHIYLHKAKTAED